MEEILDLEIVKSKFTLFRKEAILLELVPILIAFVLWSIGFKEYSSKFILLLGSIYFFAGWYLFKGLKYKWYDIIFSSLAGIAMAVILIGMLFYFMEWTGAREMILAAHLWCLAAFVLSVLFLIVKLIISKNRTAELRMSGKIFFRFLLFIIIIYSTEMKNPLMQYMLEANSTH